MDLQQSLDRVNILLRELIEVSTNLRDTSKQIIAEEELAPLQKLQEDLLREISKIDQDIQWQYGSEINAKVHEEWHQSLQTFKELNQEFINNLKSNLGLIQFDQHISKEAQEDSLDLVAILSRLNKKFSTKQL